MSESNLPALAAERGIVVEVFSALKNSIYPGATDASVLMCWDYCAARGLDVMLKPVHIVPMSVKVAGKKNSNGDDVYEWRDVVMPGIGLYRIQADRAGNYAGMDAPKFGNDSTQTIDGVELTYPEWCELTVHKLIGDRVVSFTHREYFLECYATAGKNTKAPNAMWKKRPRGQLIKCTEAGVLRKAWPELGAQPTAEEMVGKSLEIDMGDAVVVPEEKKERVRERKPESDNGIIEGEVVGKNAGELPEPCTDGQVRLIKAKLNNSGKKESELLARYEIGKVEDLPKSSVNNAIDWLTGKIE